MSAKLKSGSFKVLLTGMGLLLLAQTQAFALCNGSYQRAIEQNKSVVSRYGAAVYDEDWFEKKHSFIYKSARDSWAPGVGIVYDLLTTPRDQFRKHESQETEAVNESIRVYGVALWQDEILVNNILRDALLLATENKSFQKLYQEIYQVRKDLTPKQVASFINAANYSEHFCLEEPEPVFIKNQFGKEYPTELKALFSYQDVKNALLNGDWSEDIGTIPVVIQPPNTQSYPVDPGLRPGHESRDP